MDVESKPVSRVAIRFLSGPLAEKTLPIQKAEIIIGKV